MEDIIADAKALGKKIADHPRTKSFMSAARAVAENAEAQSILKKLQEQAEKIHNLEQAGRPIEVADKRALADRQADAAGHSLLKQMMKTQADYLEMMQRINAAIDEAAAAAAGGGAE